MCIQKVCLSLDIVWQSNLINPTLDDAYVFSRKVETLKYRGPQTAIQGIREIYDSLLNNLRSKLIGKMT